MAVVAKYDLIIENQLDEKDSSLAIMKFPAMRSQFENPADIIRLNLKPKSFTMKLDVIVESNCNNFCEATATQLASKSAPKSFPSDKVDRNTYISTRTPIDDGQMFVAQLINGKLVCRPVSDQLTFRSDFSHFDLKEEVDPKEEVKPISVKFASGDRQATSFGNSSGGRNLTVNSGTAQLSAADDPNDEYQLMKYKPLLSRDATQQREKLFGKPMPKVKPDPDEIIDKKPDTETLLDIKPKLEELKKLEVDDKSSVKKEDVTVKQSISSQNIKKSANFIRQKVKNCLFKAKIASYEEIHQYIKGFGQESNNEHIPINNKEILDILNEFAVLVQGNWVIKSEILYGDSSERESTDVTGISINLFIAARDYLLWLFTKSRTVSRLEYSRAVRMPDFDILELFNQLATYRSDIKKWEIKLTTDDRFLEQFPDVVNRQNAIWKIRANKLAMFK